MLTGNALATSNTATSIPKCRVYLFTYRRPKFLARAIKSLLAQTCVDWVCEIHNDDPHDPRPGEILAEFADPRITLVTHPQNYGPTKSFNCAFKPAREEFISILEDDNTWDPGFLDTCLACLRDRPEVSLVWANMQMWKQIDESTCIPTDVFFWPRQSKTGASLPPFETFHWPNAHSVIGGLHSNGAMIMRSTFAPDCLIPNECPFNFIEHFRERTFGYPLVLIREKLANWTWVAETSRPAGLASSIAIQILLANSFLLYCPKRRFPMLRIWARARRRKQRYLIILFLAIIIDVRLWPLLRYMQVTDVLWIGVDYIKHPLANLQALAQVRRHSVLHEFLKAGTKKQMSGKTTFF
jgi:glycosyltransferase involved in cell wall biosynthesis